MGTDLANFRGQRILQAINSTINDSIKFQIVKW